MRIVLLGAPGSGKGTQAQYIAQHYQIVHISTGEMLRAEVAANTSLGQQAQAVIELGQLVSDDIMLAMIRARLKQDDTDNGFLLDGFPRTLAQAQGLDDLLAEINQPLDVTLFFDVDHAEITQRLLARGRTDDSADAIHTRLQVYQAQTAPLIDYYQAQSNLRSVQGIGDIDEITQRIFNVLDSLNDIELKETPSR